MNKIKKVLASIMAIVALLSVCAVASSAAEPSEKYGYTKTATKTILSMGKNTKICTLLKFIPDKTYSAIRVYEDKSEISKMNVWVRTEGGELMSEKYRVYPDGERYYIHYYKDQTFPTGSKIVFVGEQYNVSDKLIKYKAISY